MIKALFHLVSLAVVGAVFAGCASTSTVVPEEGMSPRDAGKPADLTPRVSIQAVNPWTHLDMNNDPDNFQFAIVSDRTGGHRPGVFGDAVGKLNLLQPEFVMSVGDLIEGYTEDQAVLDAQWAEFDEFVDALEMPFFYVPGNHDISNEVMTENWKRRLGRPYYHFVYRDVLFLCLNSEDPPATQISQPQVDYVERVLTENSDVRWTLVFLHKPMWTYEDADEGWEQVEAMLQGRQHTVFAGHYHNYTKHRRNRSDYFVLATTGGVSGLRGRLFGEFDHVVWVTMTDAGPRIANLMLEGIWDKNVRTEETAALVHAVLAGGAISAEPIFAEDNTFTSATTQLRLTNDTDRPMDVTGMLEPNPTLMVEPEKLAVTIPPNSVEIIQMRVQADQPGAKVDELMPSDLQWQASVQLDEDQPLVLEGTARIVVERRFDCPQVSPKLVDGDLSDWQALPLVCDRPAQIRIAPDSWTGAEDLSFRFGVGYDDENLYIGVEVTDDRRVLRPGYMPWEQDGIEIRLDARPESVRSDNRGQGEISEYLLIAVSPGAEPDQMAWFERDHVDENEVRVVSLTTPTGHNTEIAVPLAYLTESQGRPWEAFRLSVAVDDYDDEAGPLAQVWWRPRWGTAPDYPGSGTFVKK